MAGDILLLITRADGGVSHRTVVTRGRGSPPSGATWEYGTEAIAGRVRFLEGELAAAQVVLGNGEPKDDVGVRLLRAAISGFNGELEALARDRTGYWLANPTDEELDASVRAKYPGATWRRVKLEDLPGRSGSVERDSYREAWRDVDGQIVVDMVEARKIRLNELRALRVSELERLDHAVNDAADLGDSLREKTARRRRVALRDMPLILAPALEAATSVEELSAVTLDLLK